MSTEVTEKWGFGMAPQRPAAQAKRLDACEAVLHLIETAQGDSSENRILEQLSEVKGLFNRIVRQDQWDWFTVSSQMGHPSFSLARRIANLLSDLRFAIRDHEDDRRHAAVAGLRQLPTRLCLLVFLGVMRIKDEPGAGWIYVLSTRELRDLLKIGMTTRTVGERAKEINQATGVAIPFGVRRCWRVTDPVFAEDLIHTKLFPYRVRRDREFFRVGFETASLLIQEVIAENNLQIRTLDALAALDPDPQSSLFSVERTQRPQQGI